MIRKVVARAYYTLIDLIRSINFDFAYNSAVDNQELMEDVLLAKKKDSLLRLLKHVIENVSAFKDYDYILNRVNDENLYDLFAELPFLEKKFIILDKEKYVSDIYSGRVFSSSTSGSTGTSLKFEYNSEHTAWVEASKWRARGWQNASRGDRVFILWGRPLEVSDRKFSFGAWKNFLRNEAHFNTFKSLDDDYCEYLWKELSKFRPKFIYGYGSSISELARYALKKGYRLQKDQAPYFVQYTADHMSDLEKQVASNVFNSPVRSDYGGSEIAGIASECTSGKLHISIDHCHIEIIDQNTGQKVSDGDVGEIVVTALHNYRMPLIRYRIGDLGRLLSGSCKCGNPLPLMELVAGKSIDFIDTSFTSKVSAHYFDYINIEIMNSGLSGIEQFQVVQEGKDSFILKVIVRDHQLVDKSVEKFCYLARKRLGPVSFKIDKVETIPVEESGKRKYFIKMDFK